MDVFITGGTGYIGRHLIPSLLARGHSVRALVRAGSESKLPRGATPVVGNALDRSTIDTREGETFIQLVGVAHPSPSKAQQFRDVDLVSVTESVAAARGHFIYLSVAQPAPVMREYVAVRARGEEMIRASGLPATLVRPWYVLGPGHWWPYLILPLYQLWMLTSPDTARRLYPVKLRQVVWAIVDAVEHPPQGVRIIEAPEMRR